MKPIQFSAGKKIPTLHQMNGVYGAAPGANKFGDVAGLPGSGPSGQICKYCNSIRHNKNATQWGRCKKVSLLRNIAVGKLSMISILTQACNHFKPRDPDDKPWLHRDDFKQPEPVNNEPVMF